MKNISAIIEKQIGRKPRALIKVVKTCSFKLPRVILSSPDLSPTIFWLTCPYDIYLISRLESDGLIKKIREGLVLSEKILKVNKDYIAYRKKIAGNRLTRSPQYISMKDKGIDGIKDLSSLKCLHSHFAYYLATKKNPIGKKIAEHIKNVPPCPQKCVSF